MSRGDFVTSSRCFFSLQIFSPYLKIFLFEKKAYYFDWMQQQKYTNMLFKIDLLHFNSNKRGGKRERKFGLTREKKIWFEVENWTKSVEFIQPKCIFVKSIISKPKDHNPIGYWSYHDSISWHPYFCASVTKSDRIWTYKK